MHLVHLTLRFTLHFLLLELSAFLSEEFALGGLSFSSFCAFLFLLLAVFFQAFDFTSHLIHPVLRELQSFKILQPLVRFAHLLLPFFQGLLLVEALVHVALGGGDLIVLPTDSDRQISLRLVLRL